MPTSSAATTSSRLLTLLSLLQSRREWPGRELAEKMEVSPRTVRRDVDRLRELGFPVRAIKGPAGGYRLEPGAQMPPLLFDDDQALAVAIALRTAATSGADVADSADRALAAVMQVLPKRLQHRLGALQAVEAPIPTGDRGGVVPAELLIEIGDAIRSGEELRFGYARAGADPEKAKTVRSAQPHHLIARDGNWYLIAWERKPADWRIFRADRMRLHSSRGPRFEPRSVPGGDPAAFLSARFKGSMVADRWPCRGEAIIELPAEEVLPFAGDMTVEPVDALRARVHAGSWSWAGLAAQLLRFDAGLAEVEPRELREVFGVLAGRCGVAETNRDD